MSKGQILIIDDELVICEFLSDLLKDRGFTIEYVHFGQEGIKQAKSRNFDVVVTDLRLPDIDGIEVVREIKKFNPYSSVIVITGYPSFDTVQEALKLGADDYIVKPFSIDEISFVIKRTVAFHSLVLINKRLMKKLKEDNVKLDEKVKARAKELSLVYQIAKDVSSTLELNKVLETIVNRVTRLLDVKICSVLLFDKVKEELTISVARGLSEDIIAKTRLEIGESISGWVFGQKEALLVNDIETDTRFAKRNQEKYYNHSFISVPMVVKDRAIGVLNVNNKKSKQPFTKDDFRIIRGIAQEVAVAIENASLYRSLEDTYLRTVMALTSAIDAKDNYTRLHSENVAKYAVIVASEMKLSSKEIDEIKIACGLHDLGKIGIHDSILTKPGKLTAQEWEEMKSHPVKSGEILKPLAFLGEIVQLIVQHHERYDGKGYPYGLEGEGIKLGAKIMTLADSYDAMVSKRPYRERPLTKQEAIEEIRKNSGSQFDPQVVKAFLRIKEKL